VHYHSTLTVHICQQVEISWPKAYELLEKASDNAMARSLRGLFNLDSITFIWNFTGNYWVCCALCGQFLPVLIDCMLL
jgi:hypothetical protein